MTMTKLPLVLLVVLATPISSFGPQPQYQGALRRSSGHDHHHHHQPPRITQASSQLRMMLDPTPLVDAVSSTMTAAAATTTLNIETLSDRLTQFAETGGLPVLALAVTLTDSIPLVPTQPISILAGAVLGFKGGLAAVTLGQTAATLLALVAGRQFAPTILEWLGEEKADKVQKVLQQLGLDGAANSLQVFTTILVARQSPVLPFSVGNYMVGAATSAPIVPALLGTVLGCVPLNCVWVGAGAGGMTALDTIVNHGHSNGGVVDASSPYMGALETVGVVATLLTVASVVKAVWSVWQEEEDDATKTTVDSRTT
eukprot:CAMPEP_0168727758 /NCGR_PEP_ID=MMETSP0724-20121128/5338_1 /TAXON_ID=265536 /ORGANISM="Amphiprora sp., Strain CCMP467" /LENGTH=312 /DNA_ID=CAMNT_0008774591 /DNA_START=34 /DNA_END=972 /DNA_ORIENTATION=-